METESQTGESLPKVLELAFIGFKASVCGKLFVFTDPMDRSPPGSSVHGDSPGKNTGVDCHALLQGIFPTQGLNPGLPHCGRFFTVCCCCQGASVVPNSMRPQRWQPTRLLCPWDSPGKNTGVGCHFLLQPPYIIDQTNKKKQPTIYF